jgi:hypothetical protein
MNARHIGDCWEICCRKKAVCLLYIVADKVSFVCALKSYRPGLRAESMRRGYLEWGRFNCPR